MFLRNAHGVINEEDDDIFPDVYGDEEDYKDDYRDEDEYLENDIRSWFYTFMCMNMPIVGWFYLFHKARYEEDPARKEFARAYLFYKLIFFIAGAVVLLILIWIGLGLLDQLLAYMEML